MSTGYQIDNQGAMYFLTLTVVKWIDVFSRDRYRKIIISNLDFYRRNKGLKIHAYVIMSNHVHLIVRARDNNLSAIIRDFKRFTTKEIITSINKNPESRRKWMIYLFKSCAQENSRNTNHQFWKHGNHAIELESAKFINQKMAYIHMNPVEAGYVEEVDAWIYSSQRNYSEHIPVLEIDML